MCVHTSKLSTRAMANVKDVAQLMSRLAGSQRSLERGLDGGSCGMMKAGPLGLGHTKPPAVEQEGSK